MKAPSKGTLANLRYAKVISSRRRTPVGDEINLPQRMVPPYVLCALAEYYKISVDYILGRTDKKK